MFSSIGHIIGLSKTGLILLRHGALFPKVLSADAPYPIKALHKLLHRREKKQSQSHGSRLVKALPELGPSYIKLGQFLATRPDVIGAELADDLKALQDDLPPFEHNTALDEIRRGLGRDPSDAFENIGMAIAAASIAQVHKATVKDDNGAIRDVAVKVLRPGIEKKFAKDLGSFFFATRMLERLDKRSRRMRPVAAIETLAQSVKIEMDLRLEAAAISEMAENVANDPDFKVPEVDWSRTSQRVLTLQWVDGIALNDIEKIKQAGHDLKKISRQVIQSFLRHAMRDGFFHADMHQGNLFVVQSGDLVAVDFGIMGRLAPKDRRFLAEILYGFIKRDYTRIAQVHFDAGYVPPHQSPELFAQALRAIGEPIMGQSAEDISMANLLGQLFFVTEQFDMEMQPQLMLLQKTMVVVEGVGRTFDANLNMWEIAEPVVEEWMKSKLGPEARLNDAVEGAAALGKLVEHFPEFLAGAEKAANLLSGLTLNEGMKQDSQVLKQVNDLKDKRDWQKTAALWLGALALVVIAAVQLSG